MPDERCVVTICSGQAVVKLNYITLVSIWLFVQYFSINTSNTKAISCSRIWLSPLKLLIILKVDLSHLQVW